jgi:hypothetical protein
VWLFRDTVEPVNPEETVAVAEDEKKPEDAPQSEVDKDKEGVGNEEEEKEPEDKVYFWFVPCHSLYNMPLCNVSGWSMSSSSYHAKHHLFHGFGHLAF